MNKKLFFAVSLAATMAACSSEDVFTEAQSSQNADMFAGIEKVNANFGMGVESRLATEFGIEENDRIGLAWLHDTDGKIELTGAAYQNHPLYATDENTLQPKTSIYVGEYFSYAPYDESVVSIENINFAIPADADMLSSWNGLAKDAIYISPKWTTVSKSGLNVEGEAGIDKKFTIYPRKFSNGVALEFGYENHVINLKDETDNNKEYPSDSEIFDAKVTYKHGQSEVSVTDFEYAPLAEAIGEEMWKNTKNWETFKLAETAENQDEVKPALAEVLNVVEIKSAIKGGYTLVPGQKYIASREKEGDKFFMNALPALADIDDETLVEIVLNTTYGKITITKPVKDIAKTRVPASAKFPKGYKTYFDGQVVEGVAADELVAYTESFVQVLGKNGKFETEVDFSTAIMNGMHVKDDYHLIQLLRYYRDYKLGTEYEEEMVDLYLDADADKEFKISKTSIALMQSINAGDMKVRLNVCRKHGNPIVVVTNNAKEGKEVPEFTRVFAHELDVYLEAQDWTWNETAAKNTGKVITIFNRGNLTVGSTNVEVSNEHLEEIVNLEDANITFTANVATLWKVNLTNNGTINIPATAHMRVYSDVVNNVTTVTGVRTGNMGIIDNYGVFGAVEDQYGSIKNYGKIYHRAGAKTFITKNEENEDFSKTLEETKIGIIEMTEADANVSVSNTSNKGIITYKWSKDEPVYVSPAVVRYNYLIVEGNIEFTETEAEIRYLEINGADVYVNNKGNLSSLQGVIVDKNYALNITEGNQLKPKKAAYLKGYVYNGGIFTYNGDVITYFGGEDADKENILKWTGF